MFRHATVRGMRVLCLTMVPDGGAMTLALKRLGYIPYTLRSSFQHGNAGRHPIVWSQMLDGTKRVDMQLFTNHDALVGPPGAVLYEKIFRECPSYTKVVLVEEMDKEQWAKDYATHVEPLLALTRRIARNRIAKAFNTMIDKMIIGGGGAMDAAARIAALERYEEIVKSNVPRDRLLVYRYGEGWGPLCEFLEKPVPEEPFPPYDNGVRVIGNLQERIERSEKLTYVLGALMCVSVAYTFYPHIANVGEYARELYEDYKTAYG